MHSSTSTRGIRHNDMLDKKLKDLKVKADEDPDIFWQKLHNLNAQMKKVGEGLTEEGSLTS